MDTVDYFTYQPGTVDYHEFLRFMQETDDLVYPPTSSRVDLEEYSQKVAKNAVMLVAKKGEEWIGVEAFYFNPYPDFSYTTHLCVKKEYQNNSSVGMDLMLRQRKYFKDHKTKGLRFEIRKSNAALLNYHLKTGGRIIDEYNYPGTDIIEVKMEKVFVKD